MHRIILPLLTAILYGNVAAAAGGLDGFLASLNVQARADLAAFSAKVSAQFGAPLAQVKTTINLAKDPADAFMVYQLGQLANRPYERVVQVYQTSRGKGWGVIAKELGIKPGSPAFHALKRGDFALTGEPGGGPERGKSRGKGPGKGKGHDR